MKKILLSVATLAFVGALAAGATGAFFSDTEVSSGNTFTAGAIDLTVDSTQHYNNAICVSGLWQLEPNQTVQPDQYPIIDSACTGTWSATNLGPSNQFFNFGDVKPQDQGENTISLHIDNNPAWACADIKTTANDENTLTTPETNALDVTAGPIGNGELAQNIQLFAWKDDGAGDGIAGDNIWQAGEAKLTANPVNLATALGGGFSLPLADVSTGGVPLAGGSTSNIGLAWCAGTMNTSVAGTITCSGASMGNNAQTDSAKADITLRVTQSRNLPNFSCATPITVGANDLETVLGDSVASGKWYFYDDTADTLNNSLGGFVVGPVTPPAGTGSAVVNPLADATGRTLLTNSGFGGTLLSTISALSYSYYQTAGAWSVNEAPFFRFNVDFTGSPVFQKSLVYVPIDNGVVTQGSWQNTGNMAAAGAKWQYSGTFWPAGVTTVANTISGTTARTWASILADYPAIRMWATGPQLGMRVGEPGPTGLTANLDNFSITISGITKTFDFGN